MSHPPTLLFSSFEPSGDALAAETITRLRRDEPGLRVHGLGGPKMAAAGAELLEHTTHRGSMFLETLAQFRSHQHRLRRLRAWLRTNPITMLVPVDSPAANWSICKAVRDVQPAARITHLVAPQIWAWATWRVRRLRRLTDHVLCLLPFEQPWLVDRGVPATFVGHPAFDVDAGPGAVSVELPEGRPRLAVLPGSRAGEITRNWTTMLSTFARLRQRDPDLQGVTAALDERCAEQMRRLAHEEGLDWPEGLVLVTGRAEEVLDWCDVALVASGTVTLQATARLKPMVVIYNMKRLTVFIARLLVRTRTFTLPNLVAEWAGLGRAVPELVPHYGAVEPVVDLLDPLLRNDDAAERQRDVLREVAARFGTRRFAEDAPRQLLAMINGSDG